jgi:hypothetical protein
MNYEEFVLGMEPLDHKMGSIEDNDLEGFS